MKIGTSYSRCLLDIYNGVVKYDDVLVLITRTNFDPTIDDQWSNIWQGYTQYNAWTHTEWYDYVEHEAEFRALSVKLYKDGKMHQPRQFGSHPMRTRDIWYDVILTPDNLSENPAANRAWENYKLIAGLVS